MSISYRRLIGGSALLGVGEITTRLLSVVSLAIIARTLGVHDFGAFAVTVAVAMLALPVIDIGQNALLGRKTALDHADGVRSFRTVLRNKTAIGGGLAAIGYVALPPALGVDIDGSVYALMILWGTGVSLLDSMRTMARARGHLGRDSTLQMMDGGLRLVGSIIAATILPGSLAFAVTFVLGTGAAAALGAVWTGAFAGGDDAGRPTGKEILLEAMPMAIGVVLLSALYRMDQLFVGSIAGEASAGIFATALQFSVAALAFGRITSSAAYNEMQTAHLDPKRLAQVARRTLGVSLALAAAVVSTLILLGPWLISFTFGKEFEAGGGILSVLALSLVFHYVSGPLNQLAIAVREERKAMWAIGAAAFSALIGHSLAVPAYGPIGAAWVDVGGAAILAAWLLVALRKRLMPGPGV